MLAQILQLLIGAGATVTDAARVLVGDKAADDDNRARAFEAALAQAAAEFNARSGRTWFDSLIDGLNRLPRPLLAFSAIGLFAYAMADPVGFAARMTGLATVPEPLWWLLGAVVGFYFAAREAYHSRAFRVATPAQVREVADAVEQIRRLAAPGGAPAAPRPQSRDYGGNAALDEWRRTAGGR